MTFPFKSKLERHLKSADHKLFEESLAAVVVRYESDEHMDHNAPLCEEVGGSDGGGYSC